MRHATLADIPDLLGLVEALAAATGNGDVDRAHAAGVLARLIASPEGLVLIAPGGFLAAQMVTTTISQRPVAIEHGWYFQTAAGLGLLRAYETWARERGCKVAHMASWNDRVAMLLMRAGYRTAEQAWIKAL